ncbi:feruloyl esterase B precursor [Astrocystis sublimbata]|nr:feruloyl esterase B precursor [Astrocystis sublimbata]
MERRWLSVGLGVLLYFGTACASSLSCDVASFEAILNSLNSTATVVYAARIADGGNSFDPSPEYPINATNLPALCAVKLNVKSSDETSFSYPDMGEYTHYGFAAVSTDTGHLSDIQDSSWALNNPESIVDWSCHALHGSVDLAKQIVSSYYSEHDTTPVLIKNSYYTGCATGGRQGLRAVQLYPDDFDGVLIGDAAWETTHLQSWSTWIPLQNYPPGSPHYISPALFGSLTTHITKICDAQDGVTDTIIQDPAGCRIDYATLLCLSSSANHDACVTDSQLVTLKKMFSPYTINDTIAFQGLPNGADPSLLASEANAIGYGYFQDFVYNDTSYNFTSYTDDDFSYTVQVNPGRATANDFDISAFERRGGRVLMYHGYADPLIPAGSSIDYLNNTLEAMKLDHTQLSSFLRLFLIPGMNHCVSSAPAQPDTPWHIAAASQIAGIAGRLNGVRNVTHSVPGYMDPKHDSVLALMQWVEEGAPPEELIATKFMNETAPVIESQRTLCPWPKVARYEQGDRNKAENWFCD